MVFSPNAKRKIFYRIGDHFMANIRVGTAYRCSVADSTYPICVDSFYHWCYRTFHHFHDSRHDHRHPCEHWNNLHVHARDVVCDTGRQAQLQDSVVTSHVDQPVLGLPALHRRRDQDSSAEFPNADQPSLRQDPAHRTDLSILCSLSVYILCLPIYDDE
jgi:hypothetical protein